MSEEQKVEKIGIKHITVLAMNLEIVLKEVKEVIENAPRRFGFLEYKKTSKIEPLQQALIQIIYFDHIQESEKEKDYQEHDGVKGRSSKDQEEQKGGQGDEEKRHDS